LKLNGSAAIKMPNLNKREIILVVILLLAGIIAGYYRFFFEPQWKNIQRIKADLNTQQQVLNQRKDQGWDDIGNLQLQTAEIWASIEKIYARVSNIKDEPTLLVDLYNMSVANRLVTESIKFGELLEVKGKGYSTFNITLEFLGSNINVYNFIDSLEKYTRLNRISEISFLPTSSGSSLCSLTVEFYVMHDVRPDPVLYPFMVGEMRQNLPYNMFDMYLMKNPSLLKQGVQKPGVAPLIISPPKTQVTPPNSTKSPTIPQSTPKIKIAPPAIIVTPPPNDLEIPPGAKYSPPADGKEYGKVSEPKMESYKMIVTKKGIAWYPSSLLTTKGQVIPPELADR